MLFFRYVVGMMDPWPVVMNYVLAFPLAYTLQTKFAFRTEWQLPRMFAYALSSVPSLLLQAFFALIIPEESMVCWLRYALISVLPAPIMYFIIRFIVTPMKKKKEK